MAKNIVFISIFDLTRVFYEIAQTLKERGHSIFWITTSEVWTDWLEAQGIEREDILQLVYDKADFVGETEKQDLASQIVACEDNADVSINQCLLMDRFVLFKNKSDINEYMYLYYRDIKRFLGDKKADVVVAEPTNTNELVAYMVCRELQIQFLAPWDMRFPGGRMIFNDGYLQSDLAEVPGSNEVSAEQGREALEHFAEKQTVPFTFQKFSEEKVVHARKAAVATVNRMKLLRKSTRKNLTHHDLSERLQTVARRIVNGFYLRHLCKYTDLGEIKGRIGFYPLHVQPESSIDVQGSFFSDQLKLITDIRRSLPFDTTLVVKEHPNFLGQRGRSFFRRLGRIPNVRLVPYTVSTFDIYKRAAIVFTITGTSAYEAGMLGIPAVTFTRMYFGGFSSIHYCGEITQLKPLVFKLLSGSERDFEADCRFMAELLGYSFEGYWTDPLFDPAVMAPENIQRLTNAFVKVLESDLA